MRVVTQTHCRSIVAAEAFWTRRSAVPQTRSGSPTPRYLTCWVSKRQLPLPFRISRDFQRSKTTTHVLGGEMEQVDLLHFAGAVPQFVLEDDTRRVVAQQEPLQLPASLLVMTLPCNRQQPASAHTHTPLLHTRHERSVPLRKPPLDRDSSSCSQRAFREERQDPRRFVKLLRPLYFNRKKT